LGGVLVHRRPRPGRGKACLLVAALRIEQLRQVGLADAVAQALQLQQLLRRGQRAPLRVGQLPVAPERDQHVRHLLERRHDTALMTPVALTLRTTAPV